MEALASSGQAAQEPRCRYFFNQNDSGVPPCAARFCPGVWMLP